MTTTGEFLTTLRGFAGQPTAPRSASTHLDASSVASPSWSHTDHPTDDPEDTAIVGERESLQKMGRSSVNGPDAVAAATVILTRDHPEESSSEQVHGEILMLRRDSRLSFAGGLWVFPGGRVDPGDFDATHPDPGHPDHVRWAQRNAAAREAAEECGLEVDASAMRRFSHWTPPPQAHKRFSTAFFITSAPVGAITIDDGEIRDHRWISPADALAAHREGEIELAPPTFITLVQLATSDTHPVVALGAGDLTEAALAGRPSGRAMVAAAVRRTAESFATQVAELDDQVLALYHGDIGYDGGDPATPGPRHRLWLDPTGWRYERTAAPN